jgi:hypothetical protein
MISTLSRADCRYMYDCIVENLLGEPKDEDYNYWMALANRFAASADTGRISDDGFITDDLNIYD